jgi:allantoinase
MTMATYDLVLRDVRIVRPGASDTPSGSIAVRDGRIAAVGDGVDAADAARVVDGGGLLAFPGAVDAHQHWGIYNPLEVDTGTESRAAAQGGVTTGLTYIRTGQYYLNKGGPYAEFLPEVFARSEGRAFVDYGFHVAPMQRSHIEEIPDLVQRFGIASYKIFMFYGSHGLHGRSADQRSFLMTPEDESYDYAHFEFVMRGLQKAREQLPEVAPHLSLSLHCETAEIMAAYTRMVEEEGRLKGLEAYSASRPPHSEGLAITIASYLAHATGLPSINLLHLSSAAAMEAALLMAKTFPHVDFRREVTVGHLLATYDTASGLGGKVNPPLRGDADREALWRHVLDGDVDWVVSDHACCRDEMKFGEDRDDVWVAKSGFGGAEYLLSGVFSEGTRRGLSPNRVAELVSRNPARRYGLPTKGDLAEGFDADIVLLDPDATFTVRAADSESSQEYTPFEGMTLTGTVRTVFLRGEEVVADGAVTGEPRGRYLHRPTGR